MRIGVDTGGTFTDFVALEEGRLRAFKVLSTPEDPSEAVLTGVKTIGRDLSDLELFAHGTTVTTNAAIQRRGATTGLLTTRGFRDVLQIRRTTRGELYDFQWEPPEELVPRQRRLEVDERTAASGEILVPADVPSALAAVSRLVDAGTESLAICFINAYVNGANERAVRDAIVARFPELPVLISAEILPEWREFERTSTTVVSAYVGPGLARYLERLEHELREMRYTNDLLVMGANGGLSTTAAMLRRPATSIGSGPAAGVVAQLALAAAGADGDGGYPDLIGMDVGGTSTDISIVSAGRAALKTELELEFGTTVSYPVIDIGSIGAGGGTIAWVDRGGMLGLGPQSAGADPGPACLGRGGNEPTVTDANVMLGRQNPSWLAGGTVALHADAAHEVMARLGARLGLDATAMAVGILELATAHIVTAIRQRTVERGLDPREFTLLPYGGAGPMLAARVAEELGTGTVLVPRNPGVTSALGLLLTDIRHDRVATFLRVNDMTEAIEVAAVIDGLKDGVVGWLHREGFGDERIAVAYSADLRYVGQTHELNVRLDRPYDDAAHARLSGLFAEAHEREFGHTPAADTSIEMVNLRVAAIGSLERPSLPLVGTRPLPEPREQRRVYFDTWVDTPIFERDDLGAAAKLSGPAVVEQLDATTVIPPGWAAVVDRVGNLVLQPSV